MFKRLFWIPEEKRLPLFWRIVLQILFLGLLVIAPQFLLGVFIAMLGMPYPEPTLYSNLLLGFFTCAGIVLSVFLAGRWLDRRKFTDFGFKMNKSWWKDLGIGLFMGAFLMAIIFVIEILLGWVTITDTFVKADNSVSFGMLILLQAIFFIFVGIQEEIMSRGYHLKNIAEGLNIFKKISPKTAIIISMLFSSAVFGILHAGNPNATWVSTFNIFIAGILLAVGYLYTKQLALPIGLHITWNFFQGNVFGFPVSGTSTNLTSFLQIEQSGPEWLTGGAFGPEAGVLGLFIMIVGIFAIIGYAKNQYEKTSIDETLAFPMFLDKHQEKLAPVVLGNDAEVILEQEI